MRSPNQFSIPSSRATAWPAPTPDAESARAMVTPNWVTAVSARVLTSSVAIPGMVALFLSAQIAWIRLGRTGPFYDEGIYIAAGLRTLQGHGPSDYYLTWFAGSLAWPTLAGIGFELDGLEGARIVAAICVSLALLGMGLATRNLFGGWAAFWSVTTLSISGPFAHLGHLAVYDALAITGVGLALWWITELVRRDNRLWLIAAALALGLAIIAKYPIAICGLPLVALILVGRGRRSLIDIGLFAFVTLASVIAMLQPWVWQLLVFVRWRVDNNPTFGVTPEMVAFSSLYFSIIPLVLAPAGWWLVRRRPEALVLLGALAIWPAYHILTLNSVGDYKHITFGFLFAYPLVGVLLARLLSRRIGIPVVLAMLAVMGSVGALQVTRLDHGWPDARPAADYLVANAQDDDIILVNNAWPLATYLYDAQLIANPNDVLDEAAINAGRAPQNLCDADWIVDEAGSYAWSAQMQTRLGACDNFTAVLVRSSTVTNLGTDLDFVSYPIITTIWLNDYTAAEREGAG